MKTISIVINTLNEERNIRGCIESVKPIADEIIVCDMYSNDKTVKIAREEGAVVVYHEKTGYVEPARYFAILKASSEWVLVLDADERMTAKLAAKLKDIAEEDETDVVFIGILYNYFGKPIRHGGFFNNIFPRFFKRQTYFETYDKNDVFVHRDLCNLKKAKNQIRLPLAYFLEHYPYPSVKSYVDKTVGRYALIEAELMFNRKEQFKLYKLICQPIKAFTAAYVIRAGFLDGMEGFILAVLYSAYRFAIWANLWFLEKNEKAETGRNHNFPRDIKKRINLTISCDDCGYIPKHHKAGQVEYCGEIDKQIQYMFNGLKIVKGCYHVDWMTHIIERLKGHHEPQQEKVFYEVLRRILVSADNVIMELGAFWSYYSMWFVKQVGGRALLVEPNAEKLKIGMTNFSINNLICVSLNGFIGSYYKEKDVFVDWDSSKSIKPRYSIDYLMEYFNIAGRLAVLHSDIQGAECEMLSGAEKTLKAGRIDYIFISTHKNQHQRCLDILAKYRYHIIASHKVKESVSVDGLIAASSPFMERFDVSITNII
ncbi:MAG: glycosyltransferase [Candidatus Omnitrophota bacterium]|nr:glycosyltransferase [Candidatus Omnitrophota bacterium]